MNSFKVKLAGKKRLERVEADYFRVDDSGTIHFRVARKDGYPIFVKAYAAGAWVSVENEGKIAVDGTVTF